MKQTVSNIRILLHVDNIQDEHATNLSSDHVALRDGFFFLELIKEFFPVLRAMSFELDGHDSCQMSFEAIRVNDCNDPLNCSNSLQLRDTPKAR